MITWLAIKAWTASAWSSFTSFCKERWELLVGVLVGILGMLALTRSDDARDILEKKNELDESDDEAQKAAREAEDRALKENLESFFERDEEAKEKYSEKISDLDEETKKRVKELLDSDNPEDKIAQGLRDYLG